MWANDNINSLQIGRNMFHVIKDSILISATNGSLSPDINSQVLHLNSIHSNALKIHYLSDWQ